MKKSLTIIISALLAMSLTACGTVNEANSTPTNPSKNESNSTTKAPETTPKTESNSTTKAPETTAKTESNSATKVPENTSNNEEKINELTPEGIQKRIKETLGEGYLCDAEKDLSNFFELDLNNVEAYSARESIMPSVDLDTVIVLKVKNGYAEQALQVLNDCYAQMVSYVRQYPFGTEKVMNGRIFKHENYLALIVAGASAADDSTPEEEAKLAESEYAKIDALWTELFGNAENIAVIPEDDGSDSFFGDDFFDGEFDEFVGG